MMNYIDEGIIKIDDSKSGFDEVKLCQSGNNTQKKKLL